MQNFCSLIKSMIRLQRQQNYLFAFRQLKHNEKDPLSTAPILLKYELIIQQLMQRYYKKLMEIGWNLFDK